MKTQQIRPNMVVHENIIMPNHIHFIVEITHCRGELNPPLQRANTIGSMVRGLKASITKQLEHPIFQRSYYEHIIRNQHSYEEISNYIVTNPLRWEKDQLFTEQ